METMRSHRAGSLFLRKRDRQWVAQVAIAGKRPAHGCRHTDHPASMKRPCDEGRAMLAELLRLRDAGAVRADPRLSLTDYLNGWLSDVRPSLAPATWRKHESIVRNHLGPALGHLRLSTLSVSAVRAYLVGAIESGRGGPRSLAHHRATLRRALADALRAGLVTRNVGALAEPPKVPGRERPFLTGQQARILIEGTKDDRLGPLFHLAVTTGMREAEILGLAWKDVSLDGEGDSSLRGVRQWHPVVDGVQQLVSHGEEQAARGQAGGSVQVNATLHRDNGQWVLADPKTPKSRRTIPLTAGCVAALREHRRRQLEERVGAGGKYPAFGLVFTTRTGWPMYAWHVLEALYAAEERLGLPRVGLHGLRHSAATILYAEGVDIETIADLLGHSSSRITSLLYRHRVGDMQRDAAERMGRAVG